MDLTKRSLSHRWAGRFFVGALVVGPLIFASCSARDAWHTRAALLRSEADEAGHTTARVIQGRVVTGPATTPPSPAGHVAWAAHVGQWRGGSKSRTYVVTCVVTRVDGLRIEDARTHATVIVDGFQKRAGDFADGLSIDDPNAVAVDLSRVAPFPVLNVTADTVPEPLRTLCKGALPPGGFDYQERWVDLGSEITVRGCTTSRKGAEVVVVSPCGDGLDAITTAGLASIRRDTRDRHAPSLAYGAGAAFVGLGILGMLASMRIVRSSRRRGGAQS